MSEETKVMDSPCSVAMEEEEEELEEEYAAGKEWTDNLTLQLFIPGRASPTFITIENEKGMLEQIQVKNLSTENN